MVPFLAMLQAGGDFSSENHFEDQIQLLEIKLTEECVDEVALRLGSPGVDNFLVCSAFSLLIQSESF